MYIYINGINNRLRLKIKDGYKLELQPPGTMKLFVRTKILSLEVVEVVLVDCNLLDNQYKQTSQVLYTFTPNKSYTSLLNVEQSNL